MMVTLTLLPGCLVSSVLPFVRSSLVDGIIVFNVYMVTHKNYMSRHAVVEEYGFALAIMARWVLLGGR